jgi:outer membrane protein OmpA-like peptidoglycan-associated protein
MMKQVLAGVGVTCVTLACASSPPPRELQDARVVYARAAAGDAAKLAPEALKEARVALVAAELPYREGEPAYLVRDRAYLAIRASELAQVLAATERTRSERAKAPGAAKDVRERLSAAERKRELTNESAARGGSAPEGELPPARGPATSALSVDDEPRGTVITVPATALFPSDRADFLPGAAARLEPVAEALSEEQQRKIVVETRTDSVGSNVDEGLSLRRADHVRDFLVSHDVDPERVSVAGFDESPVNVGAAPELHSSGPPAVIVSLKTQSP